MTTRVTKTDANAPLVRMKRRGVDDICANGGTDVGPVIQTITHGAGLLTGRWQAPDRPGLPRPC